MTVKIHYHSDCPFFAGCENMLAVLFNSDEIKAANSISFSFRYSAEYATGYDIRVGSVVPLYPVYFFEFSDASKLPNWISLRLHSILIKVIRAMLRWPLLLYEIYVLTRLFNKIKPDILHINNGGYPAALSARAAAISGRFAAVPKIVMVVNNWAVDYGTISRCLDYPLDRKVVKSVDLFITGSRASAARLQSVLDLPASKITSISNGIPARLSIESLSETRSRLGLSYFDGVIFGVVALLIPRKGHQVLLDAILKISKQMSGSTNSFKVLIEGSGPLHNQLVSFVNKHALNNCVEFIGDEKNIVDFMALLNVLILPSVADEDFPNVVLEAMALGKPVIASCLAGVPEQLVDGETGFLVAPRNVEQLAHAIIRLCNDAPLRMRMGQAAFCRFQKLFTEEVAVKNYLTLYQSLIEVKKI